jgi:hypothetical protein
MILLLLLLLLLTRRIVVSICWTEVECEMYFDSDDVAMDLANGQVPLNYCNLLYRRNLSFAVVNRVQDVQAYSMLKDWRDSHPHHHLRPDYPVVIVAFAPSSSRCLGLNRPNLTQLEKHKFDLILTIKMTKSFFYYLGYYCPVQCSDWNQWVKF